MGHLVMDSDGWIKLVHLELDPFTGIFSGERESIAEALVAICAGVDVDDLLAACESRERRVRGAALRLFLYMAVRRDARLTEAVRKRLALAAAALAMEGYPETTPQREYPDRFASSRAFQIWHELDWSAAEAFADERLAFESSVFTDSVLVLPVGDGTEISFGPGAIPCRVRFEELPFDVGMSDSSELLARIDLSDAAGNRYRAHSIVSGRDFFQLLRWSPLAPVSAAASIAILPALCANVDSREHIPLSVPTPRGPEPIVLYGKHLSMHVFAGRCDGGRGLSVRAQPSYGRLGGWAVPEIVVAGPWSGRLALCSRIVKLWPFEQVRDLGWRALAAEQLNAEWRQARPRDGDWRRVLKQADTALLEELVLAHPTEHLTDNQVWTVVGAMQSTTPRTFERIHALAARTDFLGDYARGVLAARGVKRVERIRELAASPKASSYELRTLVEMTPRPSRAEVRSWLGAPEAINADGSQRYRVGTGAWRLDIAWSEDASLKFAREWFVTRPAPPPARVSSGKDDEAVLEAVLPVRLSFALADGGAVVLPPRVSLRFALSFEPAHQGVDASVHIAGPDGSAFSFRRHIGPDLLLALLMQPGVCFNQVAPGGLCLVHTQRSWPEGTVVAGLVRDPESDKGYVMEGGFDIGGAGALELWREEWLGRDSIVCCLRQVGRVDGDPPCDITARLLPLANALLAPWMCVLDPTQPMSPTVWSRSDRRLDPQPEILVLP